MTHVMYVSRASIVVKFPLLTLFITAMFACRARVEGLSTQQDTSCQSETPRECRTKALFSGFHLDASNVDSSPSFPSTSHSLTPQESPMLVGSSPVTFAEVHLAPDSTMQKVILTKQSLCACINGGSSNPPAKNWHSISVASTSSRADSMNKSFADRSPSIASSRSEASQTERPMMFVLDSAPPCSPKAQTRGASGFPRKRPQKNEISPSDCRNSPRPVAPKETHIPSSSTSHSQLPLKIQLPGNAASSLPVPIKKVNSLQLPEQIQHPRSKSLPENLIVLAQPKGCHLSPNNMLASNMPEQSVRKSSLINISHLLQPSQTAPSCETPKDGFKTFRRHRKSF